MSEVGQAEWTKTAAYVALAEALEASLVTADRRLAKAPKLRTTIELPQ